MCWWMSVDTGRENWVTKCSQGWDLCFKKVSEGLMWYRFLNDAFFTKHEKSHFKYFQNLFYFSVFRSNETRMEGGEKNVTNTINQHSEKRFHHKAPYSEISNGSDASQLVAIRRFIFWGHVLSPEFIQDLVSAAAVVRCVVSALSRVHLQTIYRLKGSGNHFNVFGLKIRLCLSPRLVEFRV